uniref:V-set and transmembrane domain containing 1 n=1 Tax=Molossus molossus TaxID=27622 RepID=A0A7J8CC75_MOLMO|nr:V-set and transmembrane domain containing 1 [Molossus molossus]
MITGFLSLLCLGLCLGYEVELENEKLSKPSLNALPGPVVKRSRNVTLRCQGHFQNVTFMLGKLQDPGYRQEQNSSGYHAEFLLTDLEPKNAGTYFCAYKTVGSHGWSQKSEYLQLEVTDDRVELGASSTKTDSSPEESTKRTCHPKSPKHEASDSSKPERVSLSSSTEDPQEGTWADGNSKEPAEAAPVPTEEPPGYCECATLKA